MKTEDAVKDALKKAVKDIPHFWYYMPVQTGYGVKGIPDFVCCYRGQFIGIETKKPGRRGEAREGLSVWQEKVKEQVIKAGGKYYKIDDQESIDDFMWWVTCIEEAITDARNNPPDI
jgi:hypothetical protein